MDGGLNAEALLQRPVYFRDIELGRVVDVILDTSMRRILGLDVLCGDRARRFLPYGACQISSRAVGVESALVLSDEIEFYRSHGQALTVLKRRGAVLRGVEG
jgi:hypothetical protein